MRFILSDVALVCAKQISRIMTRVTNGCIWSDAALVCTKQISRITNRCDAVHTIRCGSCLYKIDQSVQTDANACSQTKILEDRTKDRACVF